MVQIAPSHKHSVGIFEAQKSNFAKHNEAYKNLPHAYKKTCINPIQFTAKIEYSGNIDWIEDLQKPRLELLMKKIIR